MTTVMVSGHFDPFHDLHLDYIEQAIAMGDFLICIISSDEQLFKKKGKVDIPAIKRKRILDLILTGLGSKFYSIVNTLDEDTTLVAEALDALQPNIFCRGGDKNIEDIPPEELAACNKHGIEIKHAQFRENRHGSRMCLSFP